MSGFDSPYATARLITLVLAALLLIVTTVLLYRAWLRSRITPEERERQRRAWLVSAGKMGDAVLVEFRDNLVFYSYLVRGVEYIASQDISRLAGKVPDDLTQVRAVSVRYDAKNPANSIVVAEEWSGLHEFKAS